MQTWPPNSAQSRHPPWVTDAAVRPVIPDLRCACETPPNCGLLVVRQTRHRGVAKVPRSIISISYRHIRAQMGSVFQMKRYKGSCHCGAVTFAFLFPQIRSVMRCDCSLCARKGIAMTTTTIAPGQIEVSDPEDALMTYQFGTMTARHFFCSRRGIHTFVETRLNLGHFRVNLGCVTISKPCGCRWTSTTENRCRTPA